MPATVQGDSMAPTLHSGSRLWVWKLPRWFYLSDLSEQWLNYNDLVVFKGPTNSEYSYQNGLWGWRFRPDFIKRVIGLPGDTIEIRDGTVYRNQKALIENYISSAVSSQNNAAITLKSHQFFVLGDNRVLGESIDSRYFGPIDAQDISGQAFILWK